MLASYTEWGSLGETIFGFVPFGQKPWVEWFTVLSIWVAVALTLVSGGLYLWRNRAIYLADL